MHCCIAMVTEMLCLCRHGHSDTLLRRHGNSQAAVFTAILNLSVCKVVTAEVTLETTGGPVLVHGATVWSQTICTVVTLCCVRPQGGVAEGTGAMVLMAVMATRHARVMRASAL
jgi:hypothetical protein